MKVLNYVFPLFFFPQTGLLSQSYRHQSEGRGEGFLNKVVAELLSLKDQALYTLLISIPLLTKQITGHMDGIEFTENNAFHAGTRYDVNP